jgi:hypothetical protein
MARLDITNDCGSKSGSQSFPRNHCPLILKHASSLAWCDGQHGFY